MEFRISSEVFGIVPDLRVGVVVLSGVDNRVDIADFFGAELASISAELSAKFEGVEVAEYPPVKKWREIYKSFGEKKARSSIEALIRRVVGGKGLYRINPLVDLYNLASLRFELPCGGEDVDALGGVLELAVARGDEVFRALGAEQTENSNKGEVIYRSGNVCVCRNFNYRESDVTKLTEGTTNAIIVFEDILGEGAALAGAMDWLVAKVQKFLGAKVEIRVILDKEQSSVKL